MHVKKKDNSLLCPLGGAHGLCDNSVQPAACYYIRNLEAQRPKGTHTSSKQYHNNDKRGGKNAILLPSAQQRSSAIVSSLGGHCGDLIPPVRHSHYTLHKTQSRLS